MAVYGSLEYVLTWKHWDMPSGPRICALRARAHRTSDKGFGGWLTPNTPSGGRSIDPSKMSATGKTLDGRKHTVSLEHVARFAGWASPAARDFKHANAKSYAERGGGTKGEQFCNQAVHLTGWNTPRGTDGSNGGPQQANGALSHDASLAGWATPQVHDVTGRSKGQKEKHGTKHGCACLTRQAETASGATSTCSPASTEKRGALNPEHSRWLMGYPVAWGCCGATAMQSCRKSRRSS